MKSILGRLSDLPLKELFRMLSSAGVTGELEISSAAGSTRLLVRQGSVQGEPSPVLLHALVSRSGTFCLRPGEVAEAGEWRGSEELVALLEDLGARMSPAQRGAEGAEGEGAGAPSDDPLAELRHVLAEVQLPAAGARVLVITADPRPYRAVAPEWHQRGWELTLKGDLQWPAGLAPGLVVLHLPSSATLAGQGEVWLDLVRRAAAQKPPAFVLWVGGLADPWLRHQAIVAGADFLIPAPAGEVGETARWFREEVTVVAERLLARRSPGVEGEAGAFRDLFLALHADADPPEVRASLLRIAATFYARGLLLAVRESGLESLGAFGSPAHLRARIPRGSSLLEQTIVARRAVRLRDYPGDEVKLLAGALGVALDPTDAELFPLVAAGECVALFVGDGLLGDRSETASLASLLARSGALLNLT